jgi:signal transduction histidine kinase
MHGIMSYANFGIKCSASQENDKSFQYFKKIKDCGARLSVLLNNLLDLSYLELGKAHYQFRPNSLDVLVNSTISDLQAITEQEHVDLIYTTPKSSNYAEFDFDKMATVTKIIFLNAIKYSDSHSSVGISLSDSEDDYTLVTSDKGIGIPESELDSIFDSFVQSSATNTGAGGTGLGLAIAKKVVEGHGGEIWAENNPDIGVSFYIKIPKKQPEKF